MNSITFRALAEDQPGEAWRTEWTRLAEAYSAWFLREGESARPAYGECVRALADFMPELIPIFEQLTELAGGGDAAARLLSLWKPTPYLTACSQVVCDKPEPSLIRNYDYSPLLFEGTIWTTNWLGTRVMGMGDCLWGMLDGVNEHGLAASLAFGGSKVVGEGFGIPIVLRYVLQTGRDVRSAARALTKIPVHMAYNVTLCDSAGGFATVAVAPGVRARVTRDRVATNHQGAIQWREFENATQSCGRAESLRQTLADSGGAAEKIIDAMLTPPVYAGAHSKGWGTLYTAAYRPASLAMDLYWPGRRVSRRLSDGDSWILEASLPESIG